MKTNFKYVMLMAAALTMGLSSCSNDDDATGNSPEEGVKTYASIKFTSPTTYATHPGTSAESKVITLDVFIYNTAGILKNKKTFTATEFAETSSGSGVWETTEKMETTTGPKQIYVAVNLPDAIRTSLYTANTLAALVTVAQQVEVTDIATNDAFAMGSDITSITFKPLESGGSMPADNSVSITVKRFSSKFTVEKGENGINMDEVTGGVLSELKFAVGQVNRFMFAAQKKVGNKVEDPNYSTTPAGQLTSGPAASTHLDINNYATTEAQISSLAAKYGLENTNDNIISGNLTYVSVSAKFAPAKVYTGTTGNWAEENHGTTGNFWCIKITSGNVYFKTIAEAKAYADEHIISYDKILEYKDGGTCYYTAYVNKGNSYDVFRNDFYRMTISKISGLGDVAPGPTRPTDPVEVDTEIEVKVTVAPWNLVLVGNVELTPQ